MLSELNYMKNKINYKNYEYRLPKTIKVPRRKFKVFYLLKMIFKNRKNFIKAGLRHIFKKFDVIINNKNYIRRFSFTLGEYINWSILDKKFLHSISWRGYPCRKLPSDLWTLQEIIFQNKPDVIIEIGSLHGGSAVFINDLLSTLNHGVLISIDISHDTFLFESKLITKITGSSSDPAVVKKVKKLIYNKSVMVIHDGDHNYAQVLDDLKIYSEFVTIGQYLVVEDSIVDFLNPRISKIPSMYKNGGPYKAIKEFLFNNKKYTVDFSREKFIMTHNPSGYLKKIKSK